MLVPGEMQAAGSGSTKEVQDLLLHDNVQSFYRYKSTYFNS